MPDVKEGQVDQLLTDFMVSWPMKNGVADRLLPRVPVKRETDLVPVWNEGDMLRPVSDLRADTKDANLVDFATGSENYVAVDHALEMRISDRQRQNSPNPLGLEKGKTQGTLQLIRMNREIRVARMATAATVPNDDPIAKWNAEATAIEKDIDAGKEAVRLATGGLEANVIVIPAAVAVIAKRAAELRSLIEHTATDMLTRGTLPATLFDLKVLIAGTVYTVTKKGQATQTFADVWSDNVLIAHVADDPNQDVPSFGYTFTVKQEVTRGRDDKHKYDWFIPNDLCGEKLVCLQCGYVIKDVL